MALHLTKVIQRLTLSRAERLGALPIHRRSFARVREALGLDPIQTELFAEPEEEMRRIA